MVSLLECYWLGSFPPSNREKHEMVPLQRNRLVVALAGSPTRGAPRPGYPDSPMDAEGPPGALWLRLPGTTRAKGSALCRRRGGQKRAAGGAGSRGGCSFLSSLCV